jgi:hypothetical protein
LPFIELPTAILKTMTAKPSSISRKPWVSLMLSIALLPPSIQCFSPIAYKLPLSTTINKIALHERRNYTKFVARFDLRNRICCRPSYTALSSTKTSSSSSDDRSSDEQNKDYGWTSKNLELAVPALIGMLADPLLSLMDTAYVGRVGPIELAALGACTSIFHLAFNAFRATTAATTSLVGNAKSEEEKREIVKISLFLGVVLGVLVMAILEKAGPWCLGTMGIPRDSPLFKPGIAYLGTRLYAAPAVMAIVVSEGAFRGYGDTKIPLLASMVASCINLVLDPVLMFSFGLGVKGAAAATVVSQ